MSSNIYTYIFFLRQYLRYFKQSQSLLASIQFIKINQSIQAHLIDCVLTTWMLRISQQANEAISFSRLSVSQTSGWLQDILKNHDMITNNVGYDRHSHVHYYRCELHEINFLTIFETTVTLL